MVYRMESVQMSDTISVHDIQYPIPLTIYFYFSEDTYAVVGQIAKGGECDNVEREQMTYSAVLI